MNKEEFSKITAEVISDMANEFEADGMSGNVLIAAILTMSLYASKLTERLYDSEELAIEN